MHKTLLRSLLCCAAVVAVPSSRPASAPATPPDAVSNDNTKPAGTLRDGVLSVKLFAEVARWFPGPDSAPPVVTQMFGEEGKSPSTPGPLLRMPLGTRVDLTFRNSLPDTMVFGAICARPCKGPNMVRLAPGASGHLRFTPPHAGTFTYWGVLFRGGRPIINEADASQFAGIIVVDSGKPSTDRIFALSIYQILRDSADTSKGERLIFAMNGKSWPWTERLTYTVGDSVHWRVVNLGGGEHPMHLHGFYFRVESRGDGVTDRVLPRSDQPLVVTEVVPVFHTMRMSWSPDRGGNWLFHCHRPLHVAEERIEDVFDRKPMDGHHDMGPAELHAMKGMGGLVVGLTVNPRAGAVVAGDTRSDGAKRVRLVVRKVEKPYATEPTFGYFLAKGDSTDKAAAATSPGPVLAVTRGERTAITVVNELEEPTSVHWHGIELESYYDGIPGWSGAGTKTAPYIAPRDSFTAVFTPPRAGTFMYHAHADDIHQLTAGLYGPLIVLEPGQQWDPVTDHTFGLGQDGLKGPTWNVLNGAPTAQPLRFKAGVKHRLRFYNLTIDDEADFVLENDSGAVKWTPIAKDAMPVAASNRTPKPARVHINPGETFDFEFTPKPGTYRLLVMAFSNVLFTIVVR
jgi:FtsP/CotA-like multicopper oxidase with cupredoxin domain